MIDLAKTLAIPGWTTPGELHWLAAWAGQSKVIVELGSWKGRSTRALADHGLDIVYAIDSWAGADEAIKKELDKRGADAVFKEFCANLDGVMHKVIPIRSATHDAAEMLDHLRACVDLLFIDAGHTYNEVKGDIERYAPLMRPGGVICGHDYANPEHPGVKQAVDELFGRVVQRIDHSIWCVRSR